MEKEILKNINSYNDFKNLDISKLPLLCKEINRVIINKCSETGGHIASNLGVNELIVALDYVFNLDEDKLIFDVSHQTYTHKIITGRKDRFIDTKTYSNSASFTNFNESKYDLFTLGHTSSSISLAYGMAKARDLKKENYNVIALIGDGSLSGGEAFEGLNNASTLKSNIIIVINDNDMSIADDVGYLYKNLYDLKINKGKSKNNIFKDLGYEYKYIEEGNDVLKLIEEFNKIKDINIPIIVHVHTLKGNGYGYAISNKEQWHYRAAFDIESGKLKKELGNTYEIINHDYFSALLNDRKDIILVTAGTPKNFGFNKFDREKYKDNFIDVGIAEQSAISLALGISKSGIKPIINISSNFLQRGFDQIAHEISLNSPDIIFLVGYGGYQKASCTHQNVLDILMISNIPNINYYAPCYKEEYLYLLDYSLRNSGTNFIRVPNGSPLSKDIKIKDINKYNYLIKEDTVALIGIGKTKEKTCEIHDILKKTNINSSVINALNISNIDYEFINELNKKHKLIVVIEDGFKDGGFGEKIISYAKNITVFNYGLNKKYYDFVDENIAYKDSDMDNESIISDILKFLQN